MNHSHGSLLVEESEVSVPYTAEGDDCVVTVQLISPHEPGMSHGLLDSHVMTGLLLNYYYMVTFVPQFVYLSARLLKNVWMNFDEIFGMDRACDNKPWVDFVDDLD